MSKTPQVPSACMAGRTHVGQQRATNQDNYLIADMRRLLDVCDSSLGELDGEKVVGRPPGELLIVADGMGGYANGERASQVAVQMLAEYVSNLMEQFLVIDPDDDQDFRNELLKAPEMIHKKLVAEGRTSADKAQMGTTLTAAYVAWPWCYILHVGDSQAYLMRDLEIQKITRDQTVAQLFLDGGAKESDISARFFHTLDSCIAASSHAPRPDLHRLMLQTGDKLILNSDGLTRHVSINSMLEVLQQSGSVEEKCEQLVQRANDEGGRDNITVVIADFSTHPQSENVCGDDEFTVSPSLADTAIDGISL